MQLFSAKASKKRSAAAAPAAAGAEGEKERRRLRKKAAAAPPKKHSKKVQKDPEGVGGEAGEGEEGGGLVVKDLSAPGDDENGGDELDAEFKDLGLTDWLCSVCRSLGMRRPTPVQRGCIPAILEGKDTIGTAQTGSGKTAAFALPILQMLSKDPYGVYCLVLTPTRELAFQLGDQFRALGAGMSLNHLVVVGGMDHQKQAKELARRPHVVIATPGRLQDHLKSDPGMGKVFSRARFLVLDEADRLLEPSFGAELATILAPLPAERQTLLFSATITQSIAALQDLTGREAFHFRAYEGLRIAAGLRQEYLFVPAKVKEVYLVHVLRSLEEHAVRSVMVFAGTCRTCQLLQVMLGELQVPSVALHAQLSQGRRLAALERFKSGLVPVLLATDVASRGLDIPTVDLVVNFDLPVSPPDYVHRVGRTARAGRGGWALSLVTQYDVSLVHEIEESTGHKLAEHGGADEAEVLKGMTAVYTARRLATLRLAEEGGFDEQAAEKRRRYAHQRKGKNKGGTAGGQKGSGKSSRPA